MSSLEWSIQKGPGTRYRFHKSDNSLVDISLIGYFTKLVLKTTVFRNDIESLNATFHPQFLHVEYHYIELFTES